MKFLIGAGIGLSVILTLCAIGLVIHLIREKMLESLMRRHHLTSKWAAEDDLEELVLSIGGPLVLFIVVPIIIGIVYTFWF